MKCAPLKLPFDYCDTPDIRILDLSHDGMPCIPVLGRTRRRTVGGATTKEEHVHKECVEISFCQRGELVFESMGREYAFTPGTVFVSRPDEPHRLKVFPKGLLMYWMFFRIPGRGAAPVLSLPPNESRWLVKSLLSIPQRLFRGDEVIRVAFQRVFAAYDGEPPKAPQRLLRLRLAVTNLLMAVIDASGNASGRVSASRIETVMDEIRANPAAPVSIDGLVERLAMSPSHLIRGFKMMSGLPPLAFRNTCRIAAAKRELERGKASIVSIAASLGYSSAQNFATQFRIATGKTPKEWRTMHS